MKFHRNESILFSADAAADQDYIGQVSSLIARHCRGEPRQWRLTSPETLWKIFVGGRSGILGVCLAGRVACVKVYHDSRLRNRLRLAMGLAKAKRAYRNGLRLRQLGIPCAATLGYAELRPAGPAMVVMELLADSRRLDHWIMEHGVPREGVQVLARFVRLMHDRGVSHKDLSPRNIMVRPAGRGWDLLLLDYEDVRFSQNLRRETRLKNLHHLHERLAVHVSLRDRLRFLREYAPQDYPVWRDELAGRLARSRSKYLQKRS